MLPKKKKFIKNIKFFCFSVLLEGGDEIRSLSMLICDEILPPPNRHLFWKSKMMMSKSYLLWSDWPNWRPTGGAASPGGSRMPRRDKHARGEQHAQNWPACTGGSSMPRIDQDAPVGAACPEGNSMSRESSMPRRSSIPRGEQHAQGEWH